jgi:hypothetical protein
LRFLVAYVVQRRPTRSRNYAVYPRIFYKDLSLVWRSASHFSHVNGDIWIGKGDVRIDLVEDYETVESIESTTDLPLEIQSAIEALLGRVRRPVGGRGILELILRQAPEHRVEPYRDFVAPREKAAADPDNRINGGRPIAVFRVHDDPTSLQIVAGYEPDFARGVVEKSISHSNLYGGRLQRFRILSGNRRIQYLFIAGPKHVWIIPPQATTTELSSYGVRTIDVIADDDLFIPGYEYHHVEETAKGPKLYSQIPDGFAGVTCPFDDAKADASPWLEQIPLIREFRRKLLNGR